MKKALVIIVGLVVLLVIAVLSIPRFINWNSYRSRIAAAVKDATGRELRIDGNLQVSIFPGLEFSIQKVHLSNVPESPNPDMFSLESAKVEIALLPLLSRKLVIDSLVIQEPKVFLEVDKSGQSNWDTGTSTKSAPSVEIDTPTETKGEMPISDIRFGDVRLEKGEFQYADAVTGQKLSAKDIKLTATLPDLGSPFSFSVRLVLNDEPVAADITLDSFLSMFSGQRFKLVTVLDSKPLKVHGDGIFQEQPTPMANGVFSLDVPSMRGLAVWLNQPHGKTQPDPGPLQARVDFVSQGKLVELREATIEGKGLQAKATGKYDATGEITRLVLDVEGGVLDIDRYFPPAPSGRMGAIQKEHKSKPSGNILASLSNEPFDLSGLRTTDADVNVVIGGINAAGLEVGRIALTARLKDSQLVAELKEFGLYGGSVKGILKLDATKDTLGADSSLTIDHVKVDQLAQAASDEESMATGVASGSLTLTGRGASPRALVENASGQGTFSLSDSSSRKGPVGAISGMKVHLDLPGIDKSPTLKANAVYNKEKVDVDVSLASLKEVLSGDRFALSASLVSKPVSVKYEGKVQRRPVPGLDGVFDLDVPSVARLAAWVDQPLDRSQPDPGPLKMHAMLTTDGDKLMLKQATVEGKGLKAKADGTFDGSTAVAAFKANIEVVEAELDSYLPKAEERKTTQKDKSAKTRSTGWSDTPIDLSSLSKANGDLQVQIGSLRYRDLVIPKGRIAMALDKGMLKTSIEKLAISGGELVVSSTLHASGNAANLEYQLSIDGAEAGPVLRVFAGSDRISGKMHFSAKGKAQGRSQKELVQSLNGNGDFKFLDGAINGINLAATLRNAKTLGFDNSSREMQKTDFAELSGTFVITNGVVENRDLNMLAPLVRLSGGGSVPLPPKTVDYVVTAKLVPTLEGQGGQDALAGLPIPISIKGPWSNLQYGVDWESVFREAAKDPERLKNMPNNLRQAGKGYGVDLPAAGLPGSPGTAESGAGTTLQGLKQTIQPGTQAGQEGSTATQESGKKKGGALKSLKGIFGQ